MARIPLRKRIDQMPEDQLAMVRSCVYCAWPGDIHYSGHGTVPDGFVELCESHEADELFRRT